MSSFFYRSAFRLVISLAICVGSFALSGCPGSNWSNPQLATPKPAQVAAAPPVTAAPITTPPPIAMPPPVETPPAPPASVAPPAKVPPTATDGTLTTTIGTKQTGVLVGTGIGALVYAIIVPASNGTATLVDPSNGTFTYAPQPDFSGIDKLQFNVTDSVGTSKPATVTVTVNPLVIGALSVPANIGINVDPVLYFDASQPYVDLMRQADYWQSTGNDTVNGPYKALGTIGKLDADGWPTEDALIMLASGGLPNGTAADPGPASYLAGKYQLSFNGIATLFDNAGTVENQTYDPATNTTTATFNQITLPDGSAQVRVSLTDTQRTASSPINTGITNLHVIRPQFTPDGKKWWDSASQEFTNPFLASLAPFSTLRFMQWKGTIGSQEMNWNQRTPANWLGMHYIQTNGVWAWNDAEQKVELTDNVWSSTGPNWESVIDLANVTGKDVWIDIPVRATDDYVKNLAALFKQELNPGIHVYVEYSNEIWNYAYEEQYYIDADVKALIANDAQAAANYHKGCSDWANMACRSAEHLMQISNAFASVWGSAAMNDRIRPVFCWQTGSTSLQEAMAYIKETYGAPGTYFYGVCSAPYWTPDRTQLTEGKSVDDLLADSAGAIPGVIGTLGVYTTTALYYGLHNLAYEGGPGMDGDIDLANMTAANIDPRMGQQVTQALTGAFQSGLDMFVYYASAGGSSRYGMWGATDDVFDLTRPKWAALQALNGKPITRTLSAVGGVQLPGTVDVSKPSFGVVDGTTRSFTANSYCHAATADVPGMCAFHGDKPGGDAQYGYLVVVPKAGSYTVTLKFDGRDFDTPASTAQFYVNQQAQGGVINVAPAAYPGAPAVPAFNITLPAGISLLELGVTSGLIGVQSITVTAN